MKTIVGALIFAVLVTGVLHAGLWNTSISFLFPNESFALSEAHYSINEKQSWKVVKEKRGTSIVLKIVRVDNSLIKHREQVKSEIWIYDKKDAYFSYRGKMANLIIENRIGKNQLLIMASVYDVKGSSIVQLYWDMNSESVVDKKILVK